MISSRYICLSLARRGASAAPMFTVTDSNEHTEAKIASMQVWAEVMVEEASSPKEKAIVAQRFEGAISELRETAAKQQLYDSIAKKIIQNRSHTPKKE